MKLIITVLIALALVGCSFETRYNCVGDALTYSDVNVNSRHTPLKPPTVERLVVYTIGVSDKYINVEQRFAFKKEAFFVPEWVDVGWIEVRTSEPSIYLDRAVEVRRYHREAKVLDVHYEDLREGHIYHFRGQCKFY